MAKRPICDDWGCPSMWTCARAWGRAEAYWRFDPDQDARERISLYAGLRKPGHEACADWERDKPRPWLAGAFEPMNGVGMTRPVIPPNFKLAAVECEGEA